MKSKYKSKCTNEAFLHARYSHPREPAYWSRQSLSSPSPVETEMDLLVLRERSRRGIHNNGYDVSGEGKISTRVFVIDCTCHSPLNDILTSTLNLALRSANNHPSFHHHMMVLTNQRKCLEKHLQRRVVASILPLPPLWLAAALTR